MGSFSQLPAFFLIRIRAGHQYCFYVSLQHFGRKRNAGFCIKNDAHRILPCHQPGSQFRIIVQHRPNTHQDAVMDLAKVMAVCMGFLPGHKMGIPGRSSQFPVQSLRKLQADKGSLFRHPNQEMLIQAPCFFFTDAYGNFHAGFPQTAESVSRHFGIGVFHGCYHPFDPRFDQRFAAGACPSPVGTGLQTHIGSIALPMPGPHIRQGIDFRMGRSRFFVPAFPHNIVIFIQDHAAYHGVWACLTLRPPGKFQCPAHVKIMISHNKFSLRIHP